MRAYEQNEPTVCSYLADLSWREGDVVFAQEVLERGIDLADGRSAVRLGSLCLSRDDRAAAEKAFAAAEELGHPLGPYHLAEIYDLNGDEARAVEARKRAERLAREGEDANDAGSPGSSYVLGLVLVAKSEIDEAEAALRRADSAGEVAGMTWLGWLLLEYRNDRDGALEVFRRADELGDGDASFQCGKIHEHRGQTSEALTFYSRSDKRGCADGSLALGKLLIKTSPNGKPHELGVAALQRAKLRATRLNLTNTLEESTEALERAEI